MASVAPALRRLRVLGEAAAAARSVPVDFVEAEVTTASGLFGVAGLAFDGVRWKVALWSPNPPILRVVDLARISSVRRTARHAAHVPGTFDASDFALRHLLVPEADDLQGITFWVAEPLARAVPSLAPTARLARAPGGGWACRVRTSRPAMVSALARSLEPWAAVHSASLMPRNHTKGRELSPESRLLRLAAWLLAQDEPSSRAQIYEAFPDEYGGTAQANERKFSRDKDLLRALGYVIDVIELGRRDDPFGYVLDPRSCMLPSVDLTAEEGVLVWSAALGALRLSEHPLRDDLESALRKLIASGKGLPPRAAPIEELGDDGAVARPKMLEQLVEAWERRKRVTLQYWRVAAGEIVERQVDVYGWVSRRGEWIFVGYCHLRKGVRIFYLSRVRKLKANGVRPQDPDYEIPADFDIRRWSRQQVWDYDVHPPRPATIRFRGALARLARQLLPTAKVSTDVEGARVARLEVRNLRGLVRQALAWGPDAELVEPDDGRAMARDILGALAVPRARANR